MNKPTNEQMISAVTTWAELRPLGERLLTEHQLAQLKHGKVCDYQAALLQRAEHNQRVDRSLHRYLLFSAGITANQAQNVLGINKYLRTKLIKAGVLVPTSSRGGRHGNVELITWQHVVDCAESSEFIVIKANYDERHNRNVERAEQVKRDELTAIEHKVAAQQVTVKLVAPGSLYRRALDHYLAWRNDLNRDGRQVLDFAPTADRDRWVDNYIRHRLTNYDRLVKTVQHKDDSLVDAIRVRVTAAIRKVYPFYQRGTYVNKYVEQLAL
ncbi:hypothetical protein ACFP1L_09225 [Lactiplantibacillus nangangensis]|uniref:Uncharacterized protein n=1 Tax=Lactiplantibacillus nangangensis TaxID=2559917 RepID=A0ABW1SKJ0_9LACO|nr:hypothetical protein [Lactiplantibacillus nangangensis]